MAPAIDGSAPEPQEGIGRRRTGLVYALMAVIVAGSCFDMVTGREHWPFSPYEMYSRLRRQRTLTVERLFGVTEGAPRREVPLSEFLYIQPFKRQRLQSALTRISMHREPIGRERLEEGVRG